MIINSIFLLKITQQNSNHNVSKPYRTRYTFIEDHSSIKKTPAEQAGIKLDLGQNKIENPYSSLASKNGGTLHSPYIVQSSMTSGWGKLLSESVDADKVDDIAIKFFKQNHSSVAVMNKALKNDVWTVKVFVSSFNVQSSRILSIESKTGRIISCE